MFADRVIDLYESNTQYRTHAQQHEYFEIGLFEKLE